MGTELTKETRTTPRTDAFLDELSHIPFNPREKNDYSRVVDFARSLERDLAEASEKLKWWTCLYEKINEQLIEAKQVLDALCIAVDEQKMDGKIVPRSICVSHALRMGRKFLSAQQGGLAVSEANQLQPCVRLYVEFSSGIPVGVDFSKHEPNLRASKQVPYVPEDSCPFCGEREFDLVGLKMHLERAWCAAFNGLST